MNQIQLKIYRDQIVKMLSGSLKANDLLPGERELALHYGTNVMNAKAAVNLLAHRGLVRRKRHAGTWINPVLFPELLNDLQTAGDKMAILLTSPNPTGIHWDETTCRAFRKRAAELGFAILQLEMPDAPEELKSFLNTLAKLHPEGIAILDDNFDHETLFRLRESFMLFSVPVVRLNRLGASVPLNTPNTISVDIDHYGNGRRAGAAVLSAGKPAVILSSVIETEPVKSNYHFFDKTDGIQDAFKAAGLPAPPVLDWSEDSLRQLTDLIQTGKSAVILALNLEIAARGYDALRRKNLKCPQDFRILGIDDLRQYGSYQFSTVAISKAAIGKLLADLACRRMPAWLKRASLSLRLVGELLHRKTF